MLLKENAKVQYYRTLLGTSKNSGESWKNINKILRKSINTNNTPQKIKINGETIIHPKNICEEMNSFFVNVGHKMAKNKPHTIDVTKYMKGKRQSNSVILEPTDEYEVVGIMSKLNHKKSSGHDGIPLILILHSKYIIANYLSRSYNHCMTTGVYPDVLKIAKVSAIHKRGSTEEVNNYRPISVLSTFNKIFETILCRRLTKLWDKYKIYTPSQFGFRSEHSTTLAMNQLYKTFLDNYGAPCVKLRNIKFCIIFFG